MSLTDMTYSDGVEVLGQVAESLWGTSASVGFCIGCCRCALSLVPLLLLVIQRICDGKQAYGQFKNDRCCKFDHF